MSSSFDKLGLHSSLITALKKEGIEEPTQIQVQVIPLALENKDILGQSQTGSGKTLAYLLPLFQKIDHQKREMQAVILAPTHELVMQIQNVIKLLSTNSEVPVTSTPIIGEVNINRQIEKLREKPHIIVGTTGRILELIKRKKITAHTIKTIVIDEGDRLLTTEQVAEVKALIKTTMRDRQLMVFSATLNDKTLHTAKEMMKEPNVIQVAQQTQVNPNISHLYFAVEKRDKIEMLRKLIASIQPSKAIVFINKSENLEITTAKLQYHNIKAYALHGTSSKEDRKKAMEQFRSGKIQLLIASDIAARGLDIKDVTHIFNLDLPLDSKEYLHRVGRTGRAGKSGTAISIVTQREISYLKKYEEDLNIEIQAKEIYKGAITGPKANKPKPKASKPKR